MSDTLTLTGVLSIVPDSSQSDATVSGQPRFQVPLNYTKVITWSESRTVEVVPAGEGGQASYSVTTEDENVLLIQSTTPVTITFDGVSAYKVLVDPIALLVSETTAYTDITITGYTVAGTVRLTMGRI